MFKAWRMARVTVLFVFYAMCSYESMAAVSPITGIPSTKSGMEAEWLYESPLTVFEVITPLDGGLYQYSYSFLNTDVYQIWQFGVYTTFEVLQPFTPWSTFEEWHAWWSELERAFPVYDLRQLDPNLIMVAHTWYGSGPDYPYPENPIPPGEFVEGFSFVSSVFDPTQKYYMYETLESGYAPDSGYMAAVGLTESSVVGTRSGSWGYVKSLFR